MNFRQAIAIRATTLVLATWDGYTCHAQVDNDRILIERVDNDARTQLGASVAFTWADGDKIGLEAIGSTIKGYIDDGGAGWVEMLSRSDATYGSAGYLGLLTIASANTRYDDFGGGTVVAAGAGMSISLNHRKIMKNLLTR